MVGIMRNVSFENVKGKRSVYIEAMVHVVPCLEKCVDFNYQ